MKRAILVASFLLLVSAPRFAAFCAETPDRPELVVLTSVDHKHHADVFAENKTYGEATVILNAAISNVTPSHPLPYTVTIPPRKKVKLIQFRATDTRRKWQYQTDYKWAHGSLDAKHDGTYLYRLPYGKGRVYKVTKSFGGKPSHYGQAYHSVDFSMPVGSRVYCAREGTVMDTMSSSDKGGRDKALRDSGNFIYIMHADKSFGVYVHFKKDGVLVKPGDYVRRGQLIGLSGNTGWSVQPHLHFGVQELLGADIGKSVFFRFVTARGILKLPKVGWRYMAK